MGKLIIHNLDPEQTKFFIGHLLQMGFPFTYGPENLQEPQPPPAPAVDAATAQPTSAARATSTQLGSQTVMQNPMEGWPVLEQKNKDEKQEDWNAEQEKVRLARKRSIDQPPDPVTIRQAFQDMGINVSYGSPSDAHREGGKVALPTSEQKTINSPKPNEPVTSTQPPAPAEKKVQELHPKVEEQKSSQFPQKKKTWTEQDEQDLDECGGVLVDMVNGSTNKPVPPSTEQQQQAAASVSIPRDLTNSELLHSCQPTGSRMRQFDQSRNRTGGQGFNQSFQAEGRMGPPSSRFPPTASVQAFPSHVQTDSSGFPVSQMSFNGRGNGNQRGNWGRGNGHGYWRSNRGRNGNNN
ncbi:hypothetical protein WR25_10323 [Diploscapter pachys]|uniref:Uncharacterized protein n=1 Tax=Diploscapter pachys TaxID=2018661 RepID=A0A2A2KYQ6_9BILA|nr:hypothetical protein WR25_10323 [Diploscapter pachys]